jgi:peroxiredoxin
MKKQLLQRGAFLSAASLPEASGQSIGIDSYRRRRSLVLFQVHAAGCGDCEARLRELAAAYHDLAAEKAEVLVIVPDSREAAAVLKERLALPFPVLADLEGWLARNGAALAVADRFGEIYFASQAGEGHQLPTVSAILEWLAFIGLQCPE